MSAIVSFNSWKTWIIIFYVGTPNYFVPMYNFVLTFSMYAILQFLFIRGSHARYLFYYFVYDAKIINTY